MDSKLLEKRVESIKSIIEASSKAAKKNNELFNNINAYLENRLNEYYREKYGDISVEELIEIFFDPEYDEFDEGYNEIINTDYITEEEYEKDYLLHKRIQEGCTIEELADSLCEDSFFINDRLNGLSDCIETPEDEQYRNSIQDADIEELYGLPVDEYDGLNQYDLAAELIKRKIPVENLPEKLLFNLYFIEAYVETISENISNNSKFKMTV